MMIKLYKNKGISLIVLVITVIIIVLLAGAVLIAVLNNNPIDNARKSVLLNDLKNFKEELELFKSNQELESMGKFNPLTLEANRFSLSYNTKDKNDTSGNVNTVIPSLSEKYNGKIKIYEGQLMFVSNDRKEIDWATSLGISVNNFYVVDGVLKSVIANDLVIDENGTLATIPSNVKEIAEGAFYRIPGLKKVVIPGSVKVIGKNAFAHNSTLEKLTIGNGVEVISENAFSGCSSLTDIDVPDSVKEIKSGAFAYCSSLRHIKLSKNITYIANSLFYSCANLNELIIPNKVTAINGTAFAHCRSLTSINIPESVSSIVSAFYNNTSLTNIEIDKNNNYFKFENSILMTKDNKKIITIFPSAITSNVLTIPEGVETLGATGIIPVNNTITKIELPASITSLAPSTLIACSALNEISVDVLNTKYKAVNGNLYSQDGKTLYLWVNKNTNSIVVPEGVEIIDQSAFSGFKNVINVTFPGTLKTIKAHVFNGCNKITSINIGKDVSSIHPLFTYGSGITEVNIDSNNEHYMVQDGTLFSKDQKTLIVAFIKRINYEVPYGVEIISNYAFHNHNTMESIILPPTIKEIGESFNICSSLTTIDIPSSIEKISTNCFSSTKNLKKIYIHKKKDSLSGMPWGSPYGEKAIFWVED